MQIFEAFGSLVLEGQEKVTAGLKRFDEKGKKASRTLNDFGDDVSRAGDKLTKWVSGPLAGAAAAVGALTVSSARMADNIAKTAREAGLAVEEYQNLSATLGMVSSLTDEELDDAFRKFQQRMGQAGEGTKRQKEAFERLGISQKDIQSGAISTSEAMQQAVNQLTKMEDKTKAASTAGDVFGRRIGRALGPALQGNADAVAAARKEYEAWNLTISEEFTGRSERFLDNLDLMGKAFQKLSAVVSDQIIALFNQRFVPLFRDTIMPALLGVARAIRDTVEAFRNLPGPVQDIIASFVLLAGILGPVLSIGGRLISLFARFIPLMTAFNPILLAVVATVSAAIAIFRNWDSVTKTLGETWQWLKGIAEGVLDFLSERIANFKEEWIQPWVTIVERTIGLIGRLKDKVINIVGDLFDGTIGKIQKLADQIVGNSIIPDMVTGVGKEMGRMADEGIKEADRLSKGVMDAADGVNPEVNMGVRGGRAGRRSTGAGAQPVNVDLRHSIIRDGRDMSDRLIRNGAGLTGAF